MHYAYAAAALSSFILTSPVLAAGCVQGCKDALDKCLATPASNRSTCSPDYASCLGYNPYENQPFVEPTACAHGLAPNGPSTTATAVRESTAAVTVAASPEQCECAKKCTAEHNRCLAKPGSNLSTCASDYAKCLGYNPYERQPYVEPSVCAGEAVKDPQPDPVAVDPCAKECADKKNACLTAPGSNKSTCTAEYASCLGYNPYERPTYIEPTACSKPTSSPTWADPSKPTQDACAKDCTDKKNACLAAPGSNKSTCAAEYASCLGHNPYGKQPYVEPTACSRSAPGPTEDPSKPTQDACAKDCIDRKNACLTAPGSNKSTCAAEYASCLGYNPYGRQPYVEPTACSRPTPAPTWVDPGKPTQDACAKDCIDRKNACLTAPGSNKSTCAAEYASCLGYNPYGKQPYVEPTACSSRGQPRATHAPPATHAPTATRSGGGVPLGTGTPGGGGSCTAECDEAKNRCLAAPGSNKSTCVADAEACRARCPARPSQTSALAPIATAGGGRVRPVVGLAALAAAALL